jgi:hypothetical protein
VAGLIDIGGGWVARWDDALDDRVNITPLGEDGEAVYIRKEAEFTLGPVFGHFPTIPIVFQQVAWPAVPNIVIEDEIITNSTGTDWGGFRFQLLDHGEVVFDRDATMGSGGGGPIGWTIDPFTTGDYLHDDAQLDLGGGIIEDGAVWTPGGAFGSDQLWITASPHPDEPFQVFTLKETPLLPAPAALALLALAGVTTRRRRAG